MLVKEAVGAAAAELGVAQVGYAAEHGRDPAVRPSQLVLDLREAAGPIGRGGQRVQQLAHEVTAAVMEAGDLAGIIHGVMRRVLGETGRDPGARHRPKLPNKAGSPPLEAAYRQKVLLGCRVSLHAALLRGSDRGKDEELGRVQVALEHQDAAQAV